MTIGAIGATYPLTVTLVWDQPDQEPKTITLTAEDPTYDLDIPANCVGLRAKASGAQDLTIV